MGIYFLLITIKKTLLVLESKSFLIYSIFFKVPVILDLFSRAILDNFEEYHFYKYNSSKTFPPK